MQDHDQMLSINKNLENKNKMCDLERKLYALIERFHERLGLECVKTRKIGVGKDENETTTTPSLFQRLTQVLTQPTGILGLTIYISVESLVSSSGGHWKKE